MKTLLHEHDTSNDSPASEPFVPFAAVVVAGRAPSFFDALTVERFTAKIERRDEHDLWTASKSNGFGVFMLGASPTDVRSIAWVLANRCDIPADLLPRAACGETYCIRGDHLELKPRQRPARTRPNTRATFGELVPPSLDRLACAQFGTRQIPHRSAEEIVAFLREKGRASIVYESGAAVVFTRQGMVYGDTFDDALDKAIQASAGQ
jgi:hypothetical protein